MRILFLISFLLLIPINSLADDMDYYDDKCKEEVSNFYVSANVHSEYFNFQDMVKLKTSNYFGNILNNTKIDPESVQKWYDLYSKNNNTISNSIAFGYALSNHRFEIEALYSNLLMLSNVVSMLNSDTSLQSSSLLFGILLSPFAALANYYYYYNPLSDSLPVSPFFSVGFGLSVHKNLAAQAKIGISYSITPRIKLVGSLRYFITTVKDISALSDFIEVSDMFSATGIQVGVIFHF